MKNCFVVSLLALTICAVSIFAGEIKASEYDEGIELPEQDVVVIIPDDEEKEASGQNTGSGFLSQQEIKEQIVEYYRQHAPNRMIIRLYLLAIRAGSTSKPVWNQGEGYREETSSNERWVYFLEGRSPDTAKDFYGNIDSTKELVLLAKYNYDYLKQTWQISSIEQVKDKKIFRVDD